MYLVWERYNWMLASCVAMGPKCEAAIRRREKQRCVFVDSSTNNKGTQRYVERRYFFAVSTVSQWMAWKEKGEKFFVKNVFALSRGRRVEVDPTDRSEEGSENAMILESTPFSAV